jgi:hypothetical protein
MFQPKRKFIVQLYVYEVVPSKRPYAEDAASDPPVTMEPVANYEVGMDVDWRETARGMPLDVANQKFRAVLKALELNTWSKLEKTLEVWRMM